MSVFYLLPARHVIAADFRHYLEAWFPGVSPTADVADRLGEMIQSMADNFVVFADDLIATDSVLATLRQSFGAQPGDWVVDARGGPAPAGVTRPVGSVGADIFPARLAAAC
ncbi:MAG TPA: hypothetical protein VL371_21710 [Gemmataceae bacterium]|jgi:hypothetical protein|nr:hypothetical protein [Gemmataceae bacterium]